MLMWLRTRLSTLQSMSLSAIQGQSLWLIHLWLLTPNVEPDDWEGPSKGLWHETVTVVDSSRSFTWVLWSTLIKREVTFTKHILYARLGNFFHTWFLSFLPATQQHLSYHPHVHLGKFSLVEIKMICRLIVAQLVADRNGIDTLLGRFRLQGTETPI